MYKMNTAICALALVAASLAPLRAEPVKIGVLTDLSGPNSNFGGTGSVVAAELAVQDFGGSVLGRPIEIVSADHQNKPDVGSAIARRWYDRDGVNVIVDIPVSSIGLAVAEVAANSRKIVINSGSSTSKLIEENCSPYSFQWTYDAYALAKGLATAMLQQGGKKWFMITADYAAGHSVEAAMEKFVVAAGGSIVDRVRHPVGTSDFSSYLIRAQASGADVIGIANFSEDTVNTIKQANEFGLTGGKQKLAVFFMSLPQIRSGGAGLMQGLAFATAHVWNRNDETRAWSKRFFARQRVMPSDFQASVYSAVLSYLKAVKAAGTTDADAVAAKLRELKVDDQFAHGGTVEANGSHVHDLFLVEIKGGKEQKEEWDYMKILKVIPGKEVFKPLGESACPLLR